MAISDIRNSECNKYVSQTIFTIGYEGKTPDSFTDQLISNGIKRLIDVRERAQSRKPGFSQKRLAQILSDNGIEYLHFKMLGSPKNLRIELNQNGDFDKFAEAYKKYLASQREAVNELVRNASEKPTAIMCYELGSGRCHRSMIASEIAKFGFNIRNL